MPNTKQMAAATQWHQTGGTHCGHRRIEHHVKGGGATAAVDGLGGGSVHGRCVLAAAPSAAQRLTPNEYTVRDVSVLPGRSTVVGNAA